MVDEMNPLQALSESLVNAVEKAGESIVLVNARHRIPASGIVYAPDLILSADHVVERDENITITPGNGHPVSASIAGRDPGNDIILLRVNGGNLTPAAKASHEARVGQVVLALGRPGLEGIEACLGIVSAIGGRARTGRGGLLEGYIRTDAIPFPGFSGGPLIDTEGKVLGMNTSGLAHGAAITIPADQVWAGAENLAKFGYVKRGYLGIRSEQVELASDLRKALGREQETGLLLVSVERGSPAEAAGLMVGDILVGLEGQPIADHDELMVLLAGETVGRSIAVEVLRGGNLTSLEIKVGERK